MATPKEIAFQAFYLPTFCKIAAAHGYPLDTPEAVHEALDLTANALQLVSSQGTSQIKQASHAMKRALGGPAKEAAPVYDFSKAAASMAEDPELLQIALAL